MHPHITAICIQYHTSPPDTSTPKTTAPTHKSGTISNGTALLRFAATAPKKVSCYEYELAVNESKRRIKIISPTIIKTVLDNFRDII